MHKTGLNFENGTLKDNNNQNSYNEHLEMEPPNQIYLTSSSYERSVAGENKFTLAAVSTLLGAWLI